MATTEQDQLNLALTEQENRTGKASSGRIEAANIPSALNTINSDSIRDERDIDVPVAPPASPITPELGKFEAQDTFTQDLEKQAAKSEKAKDRSMEQLLGNILDTKGEAELTTTAYSREGGVDDIQSELNDINQQIRAEQHALRRRIERIQDNKEGKSFGAVSQDIDVAELESYRKQADLYVIQQGVQGRYDSARAIADRAIAVQLERDQTRLTALQFIYNENKEAFTKDEQRAFETKQADRERKIEEAYYRERAKFDQLLSQQDPLYKLQVQKLRQELENFGKKTPEEVEADQKAMREAEGQIPALEAKINLIEAIEKSPALDSIVGPNPFSRAATSFSGTVGRYLLGGFPALQGLKDKASGADDDFVAGVEQLISKEFLDSLINVKAQGATFGALQKAEQDALTNAASKIGFWRVTKGKGEEKEVVGYDAPEDAFLRELNIIKNTAKIAHQRASGQILTSDEAAFFDGLEESGVGFDPSY